MEILTKNNIDKQNFSLFIRDLSETLNTNLKHTIEDTLNEDTSVSALYQRLHDISDLIERLYKEETITAATARKMGKLVGQIGKLVQGVNNETKEYFK